MADKTKKLKDKLYTLSHSYIRNRDSVVMGAYKGYCFDCGKWCEGQNFQAGHWIPDAGGGATLRYHPHNMHGQSGGCNMKYNQERVKIDYTFKMIEKYGEERVQELRQLKNKVIKADSIFYSKMIELYEAGDEQAIIDFLEN